MPAPERANRLLGPLGRRLTAGSLAIALASIALLAGVTLLVVDIDLGSTGQEQETTYSGAISSAISSAYLAADGWATADLVPAATLARVQGVGLELQAGGRTLLSIAPSVAGGTPKQLAITADGKKVATAVLTYPASGLSPADLSLRQSLRNGVIAASALAALLALVAAVLASHRLVAPLRSLTVAAERLGAGDRSSRVGELHAPGELGQLAHAFDDMASDLERQDALRRALVADVAHELRTPLAVLQAELEAVSTGLHDFSSQTVDSLSDEVARLTRLVEDLGVLAAAQAAGLQLNRQAVDLAGVASTAASRLSTRFAERDIELAVHLVPLTVVGDPGRLEQVVVNLLSNAGKFGPPGTHVGLRVERQGNDACLSVSDDGPGIAPDEQAKVFDRFYRGTTDVNTAGSGIGLAVVHEIVTAHGGSVALESAPGKGGIFTVRLPLA